MPSRTHSRNKTKNKPPHGSTNSSSFRPSHQAVARRRRGTNMELKSEVLGLKRRRSGRKGKVTTQIHSPFSRRRAGGVGQRPDRRAKISRPPNQASNVKMLLAFRSVGKHFPQELFGYCIEIYFTFIYFNLSYSKLTQRPK